MHALFLLAALLLAAALGGLGALGLRLAPAGDRRSLALAVLAAPPFVLGLAAFHLIPSFWLACAPLEGWDRPASFGLLGLIAGVAAGGLALNLTRLALVERLLLFCRRLPEADLPVHIGALARRLGLASPAVRLVRSDAPLAITGGLWRPTIVLSSWQVHLLDRAELEAVLSHELAHLARRDHLARWLGRLLRDMTVYLPGAWYALSVLESDQELAADALAVDATHRPLAMASALAKVWREALGAGRLAGLAGLPAYAAGSTALLEERLTRLLEGRTRRPARLYGRLLAGAGALSLGGLAPRLLATSATVLPYVCTMRPG